MAHRVFVSAVRRMMKTNIRKERLARTQMLIRTYSVIQSALCVGLW